MDYANALNTALGLEETPAFKPTFKQTKPTKQARQPIKPIVNVGTPGHIDHGRPAFDISTYVINADIQEALKRFPGSVLNVSPINGAVEFIFGKQTS